MTEAQLPTAPDRPAPPLRRALLRLRRAFAPMTAGDPWIEALCLAIVAWYCLTRGIYQGKASGDGFFGFMYLPGLVFHHTFDIAPNVPTWVQILGHEKTGHVANACPVGPVLFWMPTYLVAIALEQLQMVLTHARPPPLPGQSPFDFWMAGLGSLVAALFGIGLLYRLLARHLGVGAARVGVTCGVLATPIAWYIVTQPLYQHATAFFVVTLLVERWDAWRGDERGLTVARMAALGAIGGLAMMTRIQEAIWLLLPGLDALAGVLSSLRSGDRKGVGRHFAGGVMLAVMALVVVSPQLILWHWYFGELRTPQPPHHMRWDDPAIVAMVFSVRGGLLPWSPILYLLVPGLVAARKPLAGLAWRLGLLLAVELWVNASAWDHWASWTFGARRFTDATVTFTIAIGGLWWWATQRPRGRATRRALAAALALCVAWNGLMMELVRQQSIKSSGAGTFPASTWIGWLNGKKFWVGPWQVELRGPRWLARTFDRVGFPFVQPAAWIYSLVYHVPPSTFEGVVGGYFLERDSRIHQVIHTPNLAFEFPGSYVPEGLAGPAKGGLVPAKPRVRVLVPLAAREPIKLTLVGEFGGREREVRAAWNGQPLEAQAAGGRVTFSVAEEQVHTRSRTNELVFELPDGCKLRQLEFQSLGHWY